MGMGHELCWFYGHPASWLCHFLAKHVGLTQQEVIRVLPSSQMAAGKHGTPPSFSLSPSFGVILGQFLHAGEVKHVVISRA